MIVMFFLGYAEIYEPLGTIVAIIIVAVVSAKTNVASDTKYRELKDSTEKDKCKAKRNGIITVIEVDDVVCGDKILLQAGDKIPADGVLIDGAIRVDNSALNGVRRLQRMRALSSGTISREIPLSTDILCSEGQSLSTARALLTSERSDLRP